MVVIGIRTPRCRLEPGYKTITKGPFYQEQQGLGTKDWKCLSS